MPALKQPNKPPGLHEATETRVEEIAATLRDGSFRHGVTLKAFAAKWGIQYQRVGELSSLANRKIAAEQAEDHARIRAKSFAVLERVIERAEAGCDPKTGNDAGHLAVAIKAVDTLLVRSGAAAVTTSKVHVTGDLSGLTDEQLAARKAELIARLKAGEE
jgi:hypothetical protein